MRPPDRHPAGVCGAELLAAEHANAPSFVPTQMDATGDALSKLISDISFHNAKQSFGFEV